MEMDTSSKILSVSAELLLVSCSKGFDGAWGKHYPSQDMIGDGQLSEGQILILPQVSHTIHVPGNKIPSVLSQKLN